jgi:hypothetical protein
MDEYMLEIVEFLGIAIIVVAIFKIVFGRGKG